MDNPGDAKYGFTTEQLYEGFKKLKAMGAKHFGIHAFLASNTISNDYYPALAGTLFKLAVDLQEKTGCHIAFINLSGGRWGALSARSAGKRHPCHRRGGAEAV